MNQLRKSLEEYLAARHAAGFELYGTTGALPRFVDFIEERGAEFITTQLAVEWACLPTDAQPIRWASRLSMVRLFAEYLGSFEPRTEIPPRGLLPRCYQRPQPYIYSDLEIEQLLQAARNLPSPTGLRACTYTHFLGLLVVTGMRMGEAVHLDREDVGIEKGLLTLRRTKLGKVRHIPIHPTTQKALMNYQMHRDRIHPKEANPSFFLSEQGKRLHEETVRRTFVCLSHQIGLRAPSQNYGPRLHDLRHRFAVQTMMNWYRSGADVQAQLPKLSTYLGHANIQSTYWYLTAVPELLQLAAERFSNKFPFTEQLP